MMIDFGLVSGKWSCEVVLGWMCGHGFAYLHLTVAKALESEA